MARATSGANASHTTSDMGASDVQKFKGGKKRNKMKKAPKPGDRDKSRARYQRLAGKEI